MPEKFRVRYLRALHKLEVAGLVELFQGEGGRVENVRLTPEGAKIARELRVKKAKPGGVKLQLADGSVSTASVKATVKDPTTRGDHVPPTTATCPADDQGKSRDQKRGTAQPPTGFEQLSPELDTRDGEPFGAALFIYE